MATSPSLGGPHRYRWVTDDALILPDFDAAIAVLRQL
jgi:hypothetical protein